MGDDTSMDRAVVSITVIVLVIPLYLSLKLKRVVEPQIVNHTKDAYVDSTAEPRETLNLNISMVIECPLGR